MRQLLKYYAKKRLLAISAITAICFIITTTILMNSVFVRTSYFWVEAPVIDGGYEYRATVASDSPLALFTVLSCILVFIVPVFEFYFKMTKIGVDQMYSLPVKRNKLYLVKYIVGLVEIIIPLTISYLYAFLWIICSEHMFTLIYFLPYYFMLIFFTIVMYTIFAFIYTRANTFFDGIINMVLYIFIPVLITYSLGLFIEEINCNYYYLYAPISSFTEQFNDLLMKDSYLPPLKYHSNFDNNIIYSSVFYVAASIACVFAFIKLIKNDKAENSQEISNSLFLYQTTIPLTVFFGTFAMYEGLGLEHFSYFITAIIGYLLYAIYKRNFKPSWKFLLMMIIAIIISVVLAEIAFSK